MLYFLNPAAGASGWLEKTQAWNIVFITCSATYSVLFLMLGIVSIAMMVVNDYAKLKTKTFPAIYSCVAVLGFSRSLLFAFDPFGIIGWIVGPFPQWSIISRLLALLGFPSLSASYTLVFLTLYMAPAMSPSRHWHKRAKIVAAVVLVQYAIAALAEMVANVSPYPAIGSAIACDALFALWGIFTCVTYLIVGTRLLRRLRKRYSVIARQVQRGASTLSRVTSQGDVKSIARVLATLKKVSLITFSTAVVGILYALTSLVGCVMGTLLAFHFCFGYREPGDPVMWMIVFFTKITLEIPFAAVMLYSVTNCERLARLVTSLCCCRQPRVGSLYRWPQFATLPWRACQL